MQTNLLKAKMVSNGLTQRLLAESLGMSKNTLSYNLHGHRPFDVDEVARICELLHITDPTEKAKFF